MKKNVSKKIAKLTASTAILSVLLISPVPSQAEENISPLGPVTSKDTVYQIITDRFSDGDSNNNIPNGFDKALFDGSGSDLKLYQGGDWKGIINKIPYLKDMGITAVWISAPYENRDTEILDYQSDGSLNKWTSFHGYHVRNYFATNKHFGTLNEFKTLRDALHAEGIKLIIDFVTNHTSRYQNPTNGFQPEDGKLYAPDKTDTGYAVDSDGNFYDANGDGILENLIADPNNDKNGWFHHFGDRAGDDSRWAYRNKELGSLADFSQENQDVVKFLETATNYWVGMGIDGLRHDATLHMNPAFVKGLKDSVAENTTISHFGEYFIGRPDPKYKDYVYFPKQTGVNNLDFEMYRSLTSTFGDFSKSMQDFGEMLQYTQRDYEHENQAVTFIDNHDVTRFGYIQHNEKVYNAGLAAMLASRGIPNIYYGTEQYVRPGDSSDVAGRIFMDKSSSFNQNTTAYKLIKEMSDLRKDSDAIAYGETNIRYSDDDVIVFERKFYDDVALVAINRRPDKTYTIPTVHTSLPSGKHLDSLNGLLSGSEITVDNGIISNLELTGGEVNVWTSKDTTISTPKIGDIISTMGRVGNTVYIHGKGFENTSSVKFGNAEAPILANDGTKITIQVPKEATPGYNEVTITTPTGVSNKIDYNVLSGDQNQIVFHVKAETRLGENIYVVGNIPELGNWDVNKCPEAFLNPNHPEWYLPVSVPAGKEIKFKFIKKDASGQVIWEENIPNRSIRSSDEVSGVIDTPVYNWNQ